LRASPPCKDLPKFEKYRGYLEKQKISIEKRQIWKIECQVPFLKVEMQSKTLHKF